MDVYEESRDASVERCKRLIGHTRYAKNYILVDTETGLQAIPRSVLQQCIDNVHMQTIHRG
jgi:CO dehydrogenase nickel-insertion accessory protein CooC1